MFYAYNSDAHLASNKSANGFTFGFDTKVERDAFVSEAKSSGVYMMSVDRKTVNELTKSARVGGKTVRLINSSDGNFSLVI